MQSRSGQNDPDNFHNFVLRDVRDGLSAMRKRCIITLDSYKFCTASEVRDFLDFTLSTLPERFMVDSGGGTELSTTLTTRPSQKKRKADVGAVFQSLNEPMVSFTKILERVLQE
eukprot:IDg11197t1